MSSNSENYCRVTCPECNTNLFLCLLCHKFNCSASRIYHIRRHISICQRHNQLPLQCNQSPSQAIGNNQDNVEVESSSASPINLDVEMCDDLDDEMDNEIDHELGVEMDNEMGVEMNNSVNVNHFDDENDDILSHSSLSSSDELLSVNNDDVDDADDVEFSIEDDSDNNLSHELNYEVAEYFDNDEMIAEVTDSPLLSIEQFTDHFSSLRQNNLHYFWQEYIQAVKYGNSHGGIRGLVYRSAYQPRSFQPSRHLSELSDSKLMVMVVLHLLSCTSGQQDTFVTILSDILSRMTWKVDCPTMRLPRSIGEVYTYCLYGKNAIFHNLPSAPVTVLPGGHALISLDAVIDNMMALGVEMLMMQDENGNVDETGMHGTKIANKMLDQLRDESDDPTNTAFGFFTCWSDGFLTSYVCQKDNSVWILTASFIDPKGSASSQFHTICLAIGHSKADHTEVIDYYLNEFKTIRRGKLRYSFNKKKIIKTSFAMIAYLGDLPERCSVLYTSLKGTFGRRIMYAYDPDPKKFPYCQNCFDHAIKRVFGENVGDRSCTSCFGWSFSSTSINRCHHPKPPNDYPTTIAESAPHYPDHRATSELEIIPLRQSFKCLQTAVDFAIYNASHPSKETNKSWTGKEFNTYLRTCGIGNKARQKAWAIVLQARKETIGILNMSHSPRIWNSDLDMSSFVATILHLLFHGVIPDVMEVIFNIIKENSLGAVFDRHVNLILKEIANLKLEWLKIKLFPPSQWLAEDVLGLSRIMPYIFSQFFLWFEPPAASNLSRETCYAIRQILNSLHVMTSMLMSKTNIDCDEIDLHIKVFLSCCDRLSKSHYAGNVEPFLFAKSNFLSLLNLPEQILNYGHLRLYWEGTRERFIQCVKKELKNHRKTTSYLEKKLSLLQKLYSLEFIMDQLQSDDDEMIQTGNINFYRYSSREEIRTRIEAGMPISSFLINGCLAAAYGRERNGMVNFVFLDNEENDVIVDDCGFIFSKITLSDLCDTGTWKETADLIDCYCLLLPFKKKHKSFDQEYAIVCSDWDVICNGTKCFPKLSKQLFNVNVL
jgi:hypothetical protein